MNLGKHYPNVLTYILNFLESLITILRRSCDKVFKIRNVIGMRFTNLKKDNGHTHFLTLFNKSISKLTKKWYDYIILRTAHCISGCQLFASLLSRFFSSHSSRQECFSTLLRPPSQIWKRKRRRILVLCQFCRTVPLITYLRLLWLQHNHGVHWWQVVLACST